MSKVFEVKKYALEAGMPKELANRITENLLMAKKSGQEVEELVEIAKNKPPSMLVWCFMDWPETLEGVAFWKKQVAELEKAEYNTAKMESV